MRAFAATGKTILVVGDPVRSEANASASILPGECVERDSSDEAALSGADAHLAYIALEHDFHGSETTSFATEIAYTTGERVLLAAPRKGDRYQVRLPAAHAAIDIGDELSVGANGRVVPTTGAANSRFKARTAAALNAGGLIDAEVL